MMTNDDTLDDKRMDILKTYPTFVSDLDEVLSSAYVNVLNETLSSNGKSALQANVTCDIAQGETLHRSWTCTANFDGKDYTSRSSVSRNIAKSLLYKDVLDDLASNKTYHLSEIKFVTTLFQLGQRLRAPKPVFTFCNVSLHDGFSCTVNVLGIEFNSERTFTTKKKAQDSAGRAAVEGLKALADKFTALSSAQGVPPSLVQSPSVVPPKNPSASTRDASPITRNIASPIARNNAPPIASPVVDNGSPAHLRNDRQVFQQSPLPSRLSAQQPPDNTQLLQSALAMAGVSPADLHNLISRQQQQQQQVVQPPVQSQSPSRDVKPSDILEFVANQKLNIGRPFFTLKRDKNSKGLYVKLTVGSRNILYPNPCTTQEEAVEKVSEYALSGELQEYVLLAKDSASSIMPLDSKLVLYEDDEDDHHKITSSSSSSRNNEPSVTNGTGRSTSTKKASELVEEYAHRKKHGKPHFNFRNASNGGVYVQLVVGKHDVRYPQICKSHGEAIEKVCQYALEGVLKTDNIIEDNNNETITSSSSSSSPPPPPHVVSSKQPQPMNIVNDKGDPRKSSPANGKKGLKRQLSESSISSESSMMMEDTTTTGTPLQPDQNNIVTRMESDDNNVTRLLSNITLLDSYTNLLESKCKELNLPQPVYKIESIQNPNPTESRNFYFVYTANVFIDGVGTFDWYKPFTSIEEAKQDCASEAYKFIYKKYK